MPKLVYNPVDRRPPPPMPVFAVRVAGLVVIVASLVGVAYLLQAFAGDQERQPWSWDPARIRTNFEQILTTRQVDEKIRQGLERAQAEFLKGSHIQPAPADNQPVRLPALPSIDPAPTVPTQGQWSDRDAHEMKLAQAQLTRPRVFELSQRAKEILDFEGFRDVEQPRCMDEFAANEGRQAPPNEGLALRILHSLDANDVRQKVAHGAFFHGQGAPAIEQYRGHAFEIEGRLFDLCKVSVSPPWVMDDGTSISAYYEGIVASLDKGQGWREQPVEQRLVIFQTLNLPEELKALVNAAGSISHEDRLCKEAVMVKVTGAFLRRWVYSREVAPFSTRARKEVSQAWAPLLLCSAISRSTAAAYKLTDELLQQVRDSLREDPAFLETEAAYYALLARAADPADVVSPLEGLGYFDLAGSRGETGPRYRGAGVRVVGMMGDEYVPVILPPNVSGLRRVFRTLVVGDTADLNSPKRYLVDMVEPPTGLEPRAIVGFDSLYYRNVFEAHSTANQIRPLLIVRHIQSLSRDNESDWIYGLVGAGAFVLMCAVVIMFVVTDRRDRRRFEATSMEAARKRLERRGGLKLKPLPGDDSPDAGAKS